MQLCMKNGMKNDTFTAISRDRINNAQKRTDKMRRAFDAENHDGELSTIYSAVNIIYNIFVRPIKKKQSFIVLFYSDK